MLGPAPPSSAAWPGAGFKGGEVPAGGAAGGAPTSPYLGVITESTGLEKLFKLIQSDRSPALPRPPLTRVTAGLVHMLCEHLQGRWFHHCPGQPVPISVCLGEAVRPQVLPNGI